MPSAAVLLAAALASSLGEAQGEADSSSWHGRRVVALARSPVVSVELADQSRFEFGDELYSALVAAIQKSDFLLAADPIPGGGAIARESLALSSRTEPGPVWPGTYVPAATVRFEVTAFTFTTGSRGDRFELGFDENFRTPFNDGSPEARNEFPLKQDGVEEPSWFPGEFPALGKKHANTRTGLDLSDGLNVDLGFFSLHLKLARYRSTLRLKVFVDAPYSPGLSGTRLVEVRGTGWFFDLSGQYMGQGGGLALGRKDAMAIAAKKAIQAIEKLLLGAGAATGANGGGSSSSFFDPFPKPTETPRGWLEGLPLTARVDGILEDGRILLGTGAGASVEIGARYRLAAESDAGELRARDSPIVELVGNTSDGGLGKLVAGSPEALALGAILIEDDGRSIIPVVAASLVAESAAAEVVASHLVELPDERIEASEAQLAYQNTPSLWDSIIDTIYLPYRIWRFYKYDRKRKSKADSWSGPDDAIQWSREMAREKWAKRIGLAELTAPSAQGPKIAVIDTGLDYNHPVLFGRVIEFPGLDFLSGDDRPYDDVYHGTAVAGAILAINPEAVLVPIKVFNPWGITTSAAIYAGFEAAAQAGAEIIVCPWATPVRSEALRQSVERAVSRGIAIVAGTGAEDRDLDSRPAYPASFFHEGISGILPVAGVTEKDRISERSGFGTRTARIAAPGDSIRSPFPRAKEEEWSGSAVAAGLVAGALSRIATDLGTGAAEKRIQQLLDQSEIVDDLADYVQGGRRLKLR